MQLRGWRLAQSAANKSPLIGLGRRNFGICRTQTPSIISAHFNELFIITGYNSSQEAACGSQQPQQHAKDEDDSRDSEEREERVEGEAEEMLLIDLTSESDPLVEGEKRQHQQVQRERQQEAEPDNNCAEEGLKFEKGHWVSSRHNVQ